MSVEDKIQELADWVAWKARDDYAAEARKFCRSVCESPIEKLMLAAFLAIAKHKDDYSENTQLRIWEPGAMKTLGLDNDFINGKADGSEWENKIVIAPQFPVAGYRVDFCILITSNKDDEFVHVAVECDGHQWHERTKEQAQHDKARDRALQSAGFTVVRFTGSEIWRDPMKCAEESIDIAEREWARRYMPESYKYIYEGA